MTAVAEHPILFNAEMVRALSDKTQTRRVVKVTTILDGNGVDHEPNSWLVDGDGNWMPRYGSIPGDLVKCPYGKPGDRLWVRETWGAHFIWDGLAPSKIKHDDRHHCLFYAADGHIFGGCKANQRGKDWRPSIFMPRWASRFTLEVTSVRVERVKDISARDAWDEGSRCECMKPVPMCYGNVFAFESLWDSINLKRGFGWASNPWVWVVGFRVVGGIITLGGQADPP